MKAHHIKDLLRKGTNTLQYTPKNVLPADFLTWNKSKHSLSELMTEINVWCNTLQNPLRFLSLF